MAAPEDEVGQAGGTGLVPRGRRGKTAPAAPGQAWLLFHAVSLWPGAEKRRLVAMAWSIKSGLSAFDAACASELGSVETARLMRRAAACINGKWTSKN